MILYVLSAVFITLVVLEIFVCAFICVFTQAKMRKMVVKHFTGVTPSTVSMIKLPDFQSLIPISNIAFVEFQHLMAEQIAQSKIREIESSEFEYESWFNA